MPLTALRRVVRARRLAPVLVGWLALAIATPSGAAAATETWSKNLYVSSAFLYQDPYGTACTAASTMFMLNMIAAHGTGGRGFGWKSSTVKNDPDNTRDLVSILAWERAHDTLGGTGKGSDAHGWRNALNYFGWGSGAMSDPMRMVYDDLEFTSYAAAVKAAVRAIARYDKPVGMLGWAGGHAQVITGYVVSGEDPQKSDDFTVTSVWFSDPLKSDGFRNVSLTVSQLQTGNIKYRFRAYGETDSPYDDPYKSGFLRSSVDPSSGPSEWYKRWVIVAPIRAQMGIPSTSLPPTTRSPAASAAP